VTEAKLEERLEGLVTTGSSIGAKRRRHRRLPPRLVQDVAYSRLLRRRRRELHRRSRSPRPLRRGEDTIDLLARHSISARRQKAVATLLRAVPQSASKRLYANEEAILH
jgi:hypothetical protein